MILATTLALAASPARLDLWRGWEESDKVFIEATFADGSTGLFLVDTGATLSVVNEDTAKRLGLEVNDGDGELRGLSGFVPWRRATLPSLDLGGAKVENVEVAVGVAGAPEETGPLPVDGILGNNVWRQFSLVVDYPADKLELWPVGSYKPRGRAAALVQDENHLYTNVRIYAQSGDQTVQHDTTLEIDTGAGDLSLWCQTGEPFRGLTTVGVEPVFGIGAALDRVPDYAFLVPTRRVPVTRVALGGRDLKLDKDVRWSSPDAWSEACQVTPGLIGYGVLRDWRVAFDFAGGRFALEKTRGPRRHFDALGAWLSKDRARFGDDPQRAARRGRVLVAQEKYAEALALVDTALVQIPGDVELRVLKARLLRFDQQNEASLAVLDGIAPAGLAEEEEWVGYINTLVLHGRVADALARAEAAAKGAEDTPVGEELWLALSDAALAAGKFELAHRALERAIAIDQGGSSFSLRKARISAVEGDRYGAITTLRDLLNAYPMGGQAIWLYGLVAGKEDVGTYLADVDRALGRLHPDMKPLDFVGAGMRALGEADRARTALAEGRKRDCDTLKRGADRDNCEAWYLALGGDDLDGAQRRIDAALAKEPKNAAYLDTAMNVALARGDRTAALRFATEAAWLAPWDPYLLWQRGRLTDPAPKDAT